jgi:SAM-dependent methyltransferase
VTFGTGEAGKLPWENDTFDDAVSGLVLNLVPDPRKMLSEMTRVTRRVGKWRSTCGIMLGGMEMMRHFWDAAIAVSPDDSKLDQAERFPICQPEPLEALFTDTGLKRFRPGPSKFRPFKNFNDYCCRFSVSRELRRLIWHPSTTKSEKKSERVCRPGCVRQWTEQYHCAQEHGRFRELWHRNRNGQLLCDRDQEPQQAQRAKAELAHEFLNKCLGPEGCPEFRGSGNSRGITYAAHRSIDPTSRISSFSVLT